MTLSLDNLTFYFGRDYYISLNLTAEDFDPLGITSCLHVVMQVCEFTSLAMYPFVMVIIMSQSPPRMNYYRYLLMAQITSGAVFNLFFLLANPIIVFPFLIAYTDGYLECDYVMSTIMYLFVVLSIFTLGMMTIFQLVYRVLITFDRKHIFYMFSHPKIYTFCIAFCFFLVGAVIITPLALDNPQSDIHSLEIDFPALKEIFDKHPYTMGYFPEHHGLIRYVINIVFLISIALIPAIAIFCAIMTYRLRQMKKALLKQSYRLHAMLCRTYHIISAAKKHIPIILNRQNGTNRVANWPKAQKTKQALLQEVGLLSTMSNSSEWSKIIHANLTTRDFDPLGLNDTLHVVIKVFEIITICFYPFAMFVIWTRSPQKMSYYKYFLCAQITGTTVLNTMLIIGNPQIVFPFLIAYCDGFFVLDYDLTKWIFFATVLSIVVTATTTALQLIYRILITLDPRHPFYRLVAPKVFNALILVVFLCLLAIIFLPFGLDPPTPDIASLKNRFPVLVQVFDDHPYVMGYFPDHSGPIRFPITALFIISLFIIPGISFLVFVMIRRLRKMKKSLQKQTYALHAVLCRALFVQTGLTFTLFVPQVIGFMYSLKFGRIEGNIIQLLLILCAAIYSVAEVVCLLYFITPYRKFVANISRRILGKSEETSFEMTPTKVFYLKQKRAPLVIDPPSADIKSLGIDFPALSKVFEAHPDAIGYFPEHFGAVHFAIFALFLASIGVIPIVVFVFAIMTWRLKEMKKSLQKQTYKLHAILCRTQSWHTKSPYACRRFGLGLRTPEGMTFLTFSLELRMTNLDWDDFISMNLTPETFTENNLLQFLSLLTKIIEIACIATYPFVFAIIWTKSSSKMYFYKFILLAQLTSTTLLSVVLVLFNPIIVFPFTMAYLDGFFECDYTMTNIAYLLIVGSITTLVTTTAVQLAYRIMITFPFTHIFHRLSPSIYKSF
uniref:G protein-coupled receptor n=1 Tax=Panagrellus redivivus TaxID=6233 RepID=A0A7E4VFB7_PANRE